MVARAMEPDQSKAKTPTAKSKQAKAYERPRGGQARAIGDLMPQIGRTAFRRFGFIQSSVVFFVST